ncbi:MAG: hypothetical protein HYV68_03330 [Candidatus Taylorbacteria bacterium]|nr:hypothetical protein [Candidatus Taylorbacteria bacterium]
MAKIFSQTKKIPDLTPSERATMFGLLSLEFLGTRREDFIHDLEEKDAVALLRKECCDGEIVGFSTFMLLDLPIKDRKVKAVFSGDTTVLPDFRTSGGIGVELGRYFMEAVQIFPSHEIYYVLISKGWRTYKVLPFFFKNYAPKHDLQTSNRDKDVMDAFGCVKYPKDYDPDKGLIMFSRETQRLVPGSIDAVPPPEPDPHTAFFLKKNPTYLSGTELVCVGLVQVANFAAPLIRLLKTINL